jgi:hypothetical protein
MSRCPTRSTKSVMQNANLVVSDRDDSALDSALSDISAHIMIHKCAVAGTEDQRYARLPWLPGILFELRSWLCRPRCLDRPYTNHGGRLVN